VQYFQSEVNHQPKKGQCSEKDGGWAVKYQCVRLFEKSRIIIKEKEIGEENKQENTTTNGNKTNLSIINPYPHPSC